MKRLLLLNKFNSVYGKDYVLVRFFGILLCTINIKAQVNLIPNWSFEINNSTCPNINMRVTTAIPWFQPNKYFGNVVNSCSTDYFHACSNYLNNGIPNYNHGNHLPKTGDAYSGFSIFSNGVNQREYLEVELIDSLDISSQYCFSTYILVSRVSKYFVNSLSAVFTRDSLLDAGANSPVLNYIPQIDIVGNFFSDTINWIKIEQSITPSNAYKFITIGNFRNDALTNSQSSGFGFSNGTYIFLDDIKLTKITQANTKNDTLINSPGLVQLGQNIDTTAFYEWWPHAGIVDTNAINPIANVAQTTMYYVKKTQCNVVSVDSILVTVSPIGIKENQINRKALISMYPNPASNELNLVFGVDVEQIQIDIVNILGEKQEIKANITANGVINLNTSLLKAGTYICKLYQLGNLIQNEKIVIIK